MWQEFREFGLPIAVMVGMIFGFIALVVIGGDYATCKGFEAATGYETKYSFGCYAKVEDKWVPSQFVFGDAHELRKKEDRR